MNFKGKGSKTCSPEHKSKNILEDEMIVVKKKQPKGSI